MLLASFSNLVHSRSGSLNRAPASSSSTSRPREASSLATTGPPPPAPITITSRIGRFPSLVVAAELVPAVDPTVGLIVGQLPSHGTAGQRPRRRVEHGRFGVADERRELEHGAGGEAQQSEQGGQQRQVHGAADG